MPLTSGRILREGGPTDHGARIIGAAHARVRVERGTGVTVPSAPIGLACQRGKGCVQRLRLMGGDHPAVLALQDAAKGTSAAASGPGQRAVRALPVGGVVNGTRAEGRRAAGQIAYSGLQPLPLGRGRLHPGLHDRCCARHLRSFDRFGGNRHACRQPRKIRHRGVCTLAGQASRSARAGFCGFSGGHGGGSFRQASPQMIKQQP